LNENFLRIILNNINLSIFSDKFFFHFPCNLAAIKLKKSSEVKKKMLQTHCSSYYSPGSKDFLQSAKPVTTFMFT